MALVEATQQSGRDPEAVDAVIAALAAQFGNRLVTSRAVRDLVCGAQESQSKKSAPAAKFGRAASAASCAWSAVTTENTASAPVTASAALEAAAWSSCSSSAAWAL